MLHVQRHQTNVQNVQTNTIQMEKNVLCVHRRIVRNVVRRMENVPNAKMDFMYQIALVLIVQ